MVLRNSFPGFMKVFPKIFFQAPQEVERLSTDRKVSSSLPGSSCQHVEEILGEILNPDSPPSWCYCMCGCKRRHLGIEKVLL